MHTVTPVVTGIGWDVDALAILIGQAQLLVDAHPVLEGDETEHRGRCQVTAHDILGQPAGQRTGCRTATTQRRVVVGLRTLFVLVPPLTQGWHVVGRDGIHAAIGVMRQLAKTCRRILGHGLDLQRENAQFVHHPGHAVGHHTQVFCTNEHTGGLRQLGQFLHRLRVPELVVAMIEVVIVETVEAVLLTIVQLVVAFLVLYGDTRMPAVIALVVYKEQVVPERHTVSLDLLFAHAEGWCELPHQS